MKKALLFLVLIFTLPLAALEENELVFDAQGPSATDFNSYMQEALTDKDWWAVIDYADILSYHFATSPFAQEASYLVGHAYFQLGHYELANTALNAYLNNSLDHAHFEEAVQLKFQIAEAFQHGVKKPLFGSHKMPKWLPAQEDALQIYDEVIAATPHTDMAATSMLGKAHIQCELEDYKPAVETLQTLTRRFPKQEAAAKAFLDINRVYLEQCKNTSLDLDLLGLAELNVRKFRLAFPREERLHEAEKLFSETQELFAQNLLETGEFFQRTKKQGAADIYYHKVISKYPASEAATAAREKLHLDSVAVTELPAESETHVDSAVVPQQ